MCTEIIEYTDKDEVAVCNLASISLSKFANYETKTFDYEALHSVTKRITKNLNKVIDRNFYPVPEAENSNMRHRPIGIGVQGLADVFQILGHPFESDAAFRVNQLIFETIYHSAMETSIELAEAEGHYRSFPGSPLSSSFSHMYMSNNYIHNAHHQELTNLNYSINITFRDSANAHQAQGIVRMIRVQHGSSKPR